MEEVHEPHISVDMDPYCECLEGNGKPRDESERPREVSRHAKHRRPVEQRIEYERHAECEPVSDIADSDGRPGAKAA